MTTATATTLCDYCGKPARLISGADLYPHRADLHEKRFWNCSRCQAWVGCHGDSDRPLGRLANTELRVAKKAAHAAFDQIWTQRYERKRRDDPTYTQWMARGGRYKALATLMGLTPAETHIGHFSVEQCKQVVELCESGRLEP